MPRQKGEQGPETKKMYLTVPTEVYDVMEKLAVEQGRTLSNLGAFAMEYFVAFVAPKAYPLSKVLSKDTEAEEK
jgi:hypothetical protein